jgi:hypothetical protein
VRACSLCGYGVATVPVAIVVNGRVILELQACGHCRVEVVDVVARLASPPIAQVRAIR